MKRDYLSASALKAFAKSPNHYLQYVTEERTQSEAALLGSLVHCMVLEPGKLDEKYTKAPDVDRRTKEGKATWAEFVALSAGKETVKADMWRQALDVALAVRREVEMFRIEDGNGRAEVKTEGELFGVPFLGFIDYEKPEAIFDLKTTQDASPQAFQREAYNYGYHIQATVYRLLTGKRFFWIAAEKTAPFNVQVYQQSEQAFERTAQLVERLVNEWKRWDGKPQGYNVPEVCTLDLPSWA